MGTIEIEEEGAGGVEHGRTFGRHVLRACGEVIDFES